MLNLTKKNKSFWQVYKPGEIPSVPKLPPDSLLNSINGPVLDIGTGDGTLAEELSKKGFDVFGIDIAENIIKENLKRNSKVQYSINDITNKTSFSEGFFDFIVFKFTLTNIHKDSWKKINNEIHRILRKGGKIWVLEPMVSPSYADRYKQASEFIKDLHCVYVFKDKDAAKNIYTKEDLKKAIDNDLISRIVKHYTLKELKDIFKNLVLNDYRELKIMSPSGFEIKTFEGVFSN